MLLYFPYFLQILSNSSVLILSGQVHTIFLLKCMSENLGFKCHEKLKDFARGGRKGLLGSLRKAGHCLVHPSWLSDSVVF